MTRDLATVYDEWVRWKERDGGETMAAYGDDGNLWFEDDDALISALADVLSGGTSTVKAVEREWVEPYTRRDGTPVGGYWRIRETSGEMLVGLDIKTNDQDVQRAVSAVARVLPKLDLKGVTVSASDKIKSEGIYNIGGHISTYPSHKDSYYESKGLGPHVTTTTAHEIGHAIDHRLFGNGRLDFGTTGVREEGSERASYLTAVVVASHTVGSSDYAKIDVKTIARTDLADDPALRRVLEAAYASDALHEIAQRVNNPRSHTRPPKVIRRPDGTEFTIGSATTKEYRPHLVYLLRPDEVFARLFAQWIAVRSEDAAMKAELDQQRSGKSHNGEDDQFYIPAQWKDDDFNGIAEAMDALMKERGWLAS